MIVASIIGGTIGLSIGLLIIGAIYKVIDIREQIVFEREMDAKLVEFDRFVKHQQVTLNNSIMEYQERNNA
jgi:DNA-binding transcriptional regulator of glucitol operon